MTLKTKLAHLALAAGVLFAFFAAPSLPSPDGDCSETPAACSG